MKKRINTYFRKWYNYDDVPFFLFLLRIITYILILISTISIFLIFTDKNIHDPLKIVSDYSELNRFKSLFHDFKSLYAATLSLIVGYLAIKRFIYTKKKKLESIHLN